MRTDTRSSSIGWERERLGGQPRPRIVRRGGHRPPCRASSVLRAAAEHLPFADGLIRCALRQARRPLHRRIRTPGLREMRRATRPGGTVAGRVGVGISPTARTDQPVLGYRPRARQRRRAAESGLPARATAIWSTCSRLPGARRSTPAPRGRRASTPRSRSGGSRSRWRRSVGARTSPASADRRTAVRELCRQGLPEARFVVSAKASVARGARLDA